MQVFRYSYPFTRLVGIIACPDDLSELGLKEFILRGIFPPQNSAELINFCKKNPEYHIVSYVNSNMKVNKYIPGASFYFLADGDPNPQLLYSTALSDEELEIFELRIAQLAA